MTFKIEIASLKEHPRNKEIYGEDDQEQFDKLVEQIKSTGWIKPILINRNYLIISGHRRVRVAKLLGRTEIEVEKFMGDEDQELQRLILENSFREKSTLVKVREGEIYRELEERKAEERRKFVAIQNLGQSPMVETFPPSEEAGKVRDIIGEKIGMSGKSYEKARRVVQRLDKEQDDAIKWLFEDTLNSSVDAASKLVDKTDDFLHAVIEKTEGDVKRVTPVVRELEREEVKMKIQMPVGYYQVIYVDFTVPISDDFSNMFIGALADNDSVLLLWVLPKSLEEALGVIRSWGFKYKTCMVWNKDFCDEVSENGEILLISTRGNPPLMFENHEISGKSKKPQKVRKLIESTYSGTKLELLPEGWVIWGNGE